MPVCAAGPMSRAKRAGGPGGRRGEERGPGARSGRGGRDRRGGGGGRISPAPAPASDRSSMRTSRSRARRGCTATRWLGSGQGAAQPRPRGAADRDAARVRRRRGGSARRGGEGARPRDLRRHRGRARAALADHDRFLRLPAEDGERVSREDGLAEAILAHPRIRELILEASAVAAAHHDDPAFRAKLEAALAGYAGTRAAAAEITTGLIALGTGAIAFRKRPRARWRSGRSSPAPWRRARRSRASRSAAGPAASGTGSSRPRPPACSSRARPPG